MKTPITRTIVQVSMGLLSLAVVSVYAGGHHGGGGAGFSGGGHAGFSGGAHFSGAGHGYSGGGISRQAGGYAPRSSAGISAGRYGNHGTYGQRYYSPRSSTGGQIYGSSARSQSRTASRQFAPSPRQSGSFYVPRDQPGANVVRKSDLQSKYYSGANRDVRQRAVTTPRGTQRPGSAWSKQNLTNKQRLDPQTTERLRNWHGKAPGWNDAKHHNNEHWRDRHHHGRDWWHHHCDVIVLVDWGYWGWWDGWWYPAWGYDPYYSSYDYDSPIYGYDALRPDEVIADVQAALQQLGYYSYAVDGVLGPATQAAIVNYQRDYGLAVTGAIDPATVRSLGLTT
jgi:hypothetical protein